MKISVAMATYNGASFLREQLNSFASQLRLPDEVVITDDCSTDETLAIIDDFAVSAPFDVRYYKNEKNLGYALNFNEALGKVTGDLVFLSDQDDVWFPEKLSYIERLAQEKPEKLLFMNDAELTDKKLNSVGLTKIGQIQSAGLGADSFVMGCCCAVRRELLDICLPIPDGYSAHDEWIVRFAEGLHAKMVSDSVLQYYRRHESNESGFIANRTTKVTWKNAYWHRIVNIWAGRSVDQLADRIRKNELILNGVEIAQQNKHGIYVKELKKYSSVLKRKLEKDRFRLGIRKKSFLPRAVDVCRQVAGGFYKDASGIKSAMRDLLG